MRNFNLRVFVVSSVGIFILAYYSFQSAFEGTSAENHNFFTDLADIAIRIFQFPAITVAKLFDVGMSFVDYFILLLLDSFFYALLVERGFMLVKYLKKK